MKSNKLILKKLNELNIKFNDFEHYQIAFTHPSFANEKKLNYSNQVYEFLGDSVFNFLIVEYLFNNFKKQNEGVLSKYKSALISKDAMNIYDKKLNLKEALMLGQGEESTNGRYKESNVEDLFEAFFAALYLDLGMEETRAFFNEHIAVYITEDILTINKDYKTILQEVVQSERINDIMYKLVSERGPGHEKLFKVDVLINQIKYGTGIGASKKEAEKKAAKDALKKMTKK